MARTEKMILGSYALAADTHETWRLWHTIQAWWPASEVLIAIPCAYAMAKLKAALDDD